ncbi:hypothetical protein [Streptacidiphilus sp. P02-A3a]|uniref:hypothetical protein n=1 Tax=Streptacidiphilus sp. P02-A3a TaxID=2704468 RepID=UPI0015F96367|nr:hypothetical protein [Streptacidiphilus sp. P02-A3a]QMU73040.1 hypothetical protein GXP74_37165 [Streptacidiphilus sp. P02-A3a]
MLSQLTQAMVVNGVVLVAVLEGDLGPHRKIGALRILRPALTAAGIVPLFIDQPVTHGAGLVLEVAGVVAGFLGGMAALSVMTVYRSPRTGKPVSHATTPYALLWTAVIGARAAFSYGSFHWFPHQLEHWCVTNRVTAAGITDALIFMAVAMTLTRTIGLGTRAAALAPATRTARVRATA